MIYSDKVDYKQDVFSILATQACLTNGMSILGKDHFENFSFLTNFSIDTKRTQCSEVVLQFIIFRANVFLEERLLN